MSVWKVNPTDLDTLSNSRARRIRTFIIILAILDLPLLVVGLLDLRASPLTLLLVLSSYAYYAVYYLLLRVGYGVPATYVCVVLLAFLIVVGVHNGGGSLSVSNALYFLLLIGVALVLDEPVAVDLTVAICLLTYSGLAFYEAYFEPPAAPAFRGLYQNSSPLAAGSTIAGMLIALIGCWLLMRITVVGLRHSTAALERSRAEAETRAVENAALAAQVQASNESLLTTQALLRTTIDALALPLIPLDHGVTLLPLVGYLDEMRSGQMVEVLLDGIHRQHAQTVIIDLTGLRDIDASAATALLYAARGAELLGAQVMLSGISAHAAETLVDVGADLRGLRTVASLGQALRLIAEQHDGTNSQQSAAL